MKNVHLIPTDKPSRLYEDVDSDLQLGYDFTIRQGMLQNQHIYITNSEEIKEGDYYITILDNEVYKATKETQNIMSVANLVGSTSYKNTHFKIILTTDQDLIKDGVQSIDDEFLEWFVKNPSCEYVETKIEFIQTPDNLIDGFYYKIIIMKNIHLIETDKPSRLWTNNLKRRLVLDEFSSQHPTNIAKNIYITSDEEIKEGDWIFSTKTNNLFKADSIEYLESHNMIEDFDKSFYINSKYAKKIILTDNKDLIKDGVQKIDDEFIEWFVKNPSCEEVEVKKGFADGTDYGYNFLDYKIIIPKEENSIEAKQRAKNYMSLKGALEPKQETLEEFISEVTKNFKDEMSIKFTSGGIKLGAKWQQERMYSEEEVIKIVEKSRETGLTAEYLLLTEQFKKK